MTTVPANLTGLVHTLGPFIQNYGYYGVAALLLLESTGIPVPGETTLIVAAIFAGLGHLNIIGVIIVGTIASMLGDNIAFAVGDFGGRPLIEKYGKYVFITKDRLTKLEKFFNKYGARVIIVARFIDGLRQLNGFIAGISEMKWLKFLFYNALGSLIWVLTWSMVGYYGGSHIQAIIKYELYFSILALLIVVGLITKFAYKKKYSKKQTS